MGKKGFFATLFVLLILIFLLFPSSSGTEYFLIPVKVIDLDQQGDPGISSAPDSLSFSMGHYYGYFSEDLELSLLGIEDYSVSISDSAFINYTKVPSILDVQDRDGNGLSVIETTGYPLVAGDKVVVLTDSSVSLYDINGNLYWKKDILSMVTTLSVTGDHVLLGFLDGKAELIGLSGEIELDYRPGGSRIECIYSAALSPDGEYLSVLSGLDPQRFILLQRRKDGYKPVHHFELDNQFRRTVDMFFSFDSSEVFFEDPRGVHVYDVNRRDLSLLEGKGRPVGVYLDHESGFYSLFMKDSAGGRLQVLEADGEKIIDRSFSGNLFYFRKKSDNYYIGSDSKLMFFRMVEG